MSVNKKYLFVLNIAFAVFSLSGLLTKFAAFENGLTVKFMLFYSASIFILGIYAVVWQQLIKKLPLTTAYSNKAVVIVWGFIWGVIFFQETVTPGKLLGIALTIWGIILLNLES